MILDSLLIVLVLVLLFSVFYLIIRTRDTSAHIARFNDKFPFTEEVRRQVSASIDTLNDRVASINHKADRIGDVMNEITGLRNLFLMPKGAGGAGERLLEKALSDTLSSEMYQAQYRLSSGVVDFIIKCKDCIIPVDSKLSLEDFNRMLSAPDDAAGKLCWRSFTAAVKKRIDETSKYILPAEKTTDFALMYIASESVYYEAFIKDKQFGEENILMDYAIKKRVFPASPQTLYPYLMTIVQGMKALKIEEGAREILSKVAGLRSDFERLKSVYSIIAGHIENAHSKYMHEGASSIAKLEQHISGLEHKT